MLLSWMKAKNKKRSNAVIPWLFVRNCFQRQQTMMVTFWTERSTVNSTVGYIFNRAIYNQSNSIVFRLLEYIYYVC